MTPTSTSTPTKARSASSAETLKLVRKLHLYFGLFIAPALLFFAFTGAMQTLSLHESAGSSYAPPAWLAKLARLHKDQTLNDRPQKGPSKPATHPDHAPALSAQPVPAPTARPAGGPTLAGKQREHLPEKLFFLVVCLGLFSSTLSGVYMAYRYERNRLLVSGILLAGIAIPLLLLAF